MKQTVEEAAKEYAELIVKPQEMYLSFEGVYSLKEDLFNSFSAGAEWQAKQSPWISVKERLPEEEQKIFVLTMGYGVPYIQKETFRRSNNLDIKGIWTHGNSIVLAWLPIPSFDDILKNNNKK